MPCLITVLISPPTQPVVGIFGISRSTRYRMEDEYSDANLREFLESYMAGNLKRVIKSQPVPKKNNGPVRVRCRLSPLVSRPAC